MASTELAQRLTQPVVKELAMLIDQAWRTVETCERPGAHCKPLIADLHRALLRLEGVLPRHAAGRTERADDI